MVAIAATPQPSTASVLLHVTGAANGPCSITRTDTNGTGNVRFYANEQVIGGQLLTVDHEAALVGPITYEVRDSLGAKASVTVAAGLGVDVPWLSAPGLPALNIPVTVASDNHSRANRSTRHDIYGRADPVYTVQPQGFPEGILEYRCENWDQVLAVEGVYKPGFAVLLRQPCREDADHYHLGDVSHAPTVDNSWRGAYVVTVSYVDVAAPAGALRGGVWTYADTVTEYATYADLPPAFDTYADLEVGPA